MLKLNLQFCHFFVSLGHPLHQFIFVEDPADVFGMVMLLHLHIYIGVRQSKTFYLFI